MAGVVGYVTDVEGNLDYWRKYVEISKVLEDRDGQVVLKDECRFVFGGDAVDKGPGDVRVTRQLVDLKERYPDRVFLLLGNRDVNKLRFASELAADYWDREELLDEVVLAYWVEKEKRVTLSQFLAKKDAENTRLAHLRWMLDETMGCQTTFETRRQELQILKEREVTDSEVLESFVTSVQEGHEDAFMLDYLRHGQLAVVLGDTLFVHGSVCANNVGTVPGKEERATSVAQWVRELNQWCQSEVQDYLTQPTWSKRPSCDERGERGGNALMDYGVPGGNGNCTVVYHNFLSNGNPRDMDDTSVAFLSSNGVRRVVVGHAPHGDCPVVVNANGQTQIFTGDTSYSDMSAADNRGDAVSEILLQLPAGSTHVHGRLSDKRQIAFDVPSTADEENVSCLIGRQLKDDSWIKARLGKVPDDGRCLLAVRGEGFRLHNRWLTEEEVKADLK